MIETKILYVSTTNSSVYILCLKALSYIYNLAEEEFDKDCCSRNISQYDRIEITRLFSSASRKIESEFNTKDNDETLDVLETLSELSRTSSLEEDIEKLVKRLNISLGFNKITLNVYEDIDLTELQSFHLNRIFSKYLTLNIRK